MSLGLEIDDQEGNGADAILYAGGWADINLIADGEFLPEYLELEAIDGFLDALEAIVTRLTAGAG